MLTFAPTDLLTGSLYALAVLRAVGVLLLVAVSDRFDRRTDEADMDSLAAAVDRGRRAGQVSWPENLP